MIPRIFKRILCFIGVHQHVTVTDLIVEQPADVTTPVQYCEDCGGLFYYHIDTSDPWGCPAKLTPVNPLDPTLVRVTQQGTIEPYGKNNK